MAIDVPVFFIGRALQDALPLSLLKRDDSLPLTIKLHTSRRVVTMI